MNTYIGTKIINAKPMTRQEYNDFRGWQLPKDENGNDEGYLVEYLDGGKPNTAEYAGYVSWSPKAQFEAAYLDIGNVTGLKPHEVRVAGEFALLSKNIQKLRTFLLTAAFDSLQQDDKELLTRQLSHMDDYLTVLAVRYIGFKKD